MPRTLSNCWPRTAPIWTKSASWCSSVKLARSSQVPQHPHPAAWRLSWWSIPCLRCSGLVRTRDRAPAAYLQVSDTWRTRLWKYTVNSLWPSDAIWQQRSGSTLAHAVAWCLTSSSHYMKQCWLIISEIHIRAILQEMPQPSIPKICLKITYVEFHSNFPDANELILI